MKYDYSYLITLQFLGFRFHGWQKQTNAKTLHEMIDKTLDFVFDADQIYKSIGVGRTDAKVSASKFAIQLFVKKPIDEATFLERFNYNAPADFGALKVVKTATSFNIIQASKLKEYHYYFSFGGKTHPFAAPFLVGLPETLDIDVMIQGAKLFEGEHYFHKYCTKPSEKTIFKRTIDLCEIVENTILEANFFPEKTYVLKVRGKGFLRYQIRLMMGMLFELGRGTVDLAFIKGSLRENNDRLYLPTIAPASGLQLYDLSFDLG